MTNKTINLLYFIFSYSNILGRSSFYVFNSTIEMIEIFLAFVSCVFTLAIISFELLAAIWLLPVNEAYGNWPASGEIDLLECRGMLQCAGT